MDRTQRSLETQACLESVDGAMAPNSGCCVSANRQWPYRGVHRRRFRRLSQSRGELHGRGNGAPDRSIRASGLRCARRQFPRAVRSTRYPDSNRPLIESRKDQPGLSRSWHCPLLDGVPAHTVGGQLVPTRLGAMPALGRSRAVFALRWPSCTSEPPVWWLPGTCRDRSGWCG